MSEPATATAYPLALDLLPEIRPPADGDPGTLEDDPGCEHDVVHDRSHAVLNVLQGLVGLLEEGEEVDSILARLRSIEASSPPVALGFAMSDETSSLTTASSVTFYLPTAFELDHVMVEVKDAQVSGALVRADVRANGASVFAVRPTIDNGENTSRTAATPAVLSATPLAAGTRMQASIDQVAAGTAAKGAKVWLVGWHR